MNICQKKSLWLIIMVILCCIAMAVIEVLIEPAYYVKSLLKIIFFLFVPLVFLKLQKQKVFANSFRLNKKKRT